MTRTFFVSRPFVKNLYRLPMSTMLEAEAYIPWRPTSCGQASFRPHPNTVCEPVNLAAASQPPITYKNRHSGRGLSTMQVETVARIMQSFAKRGAFLLGDATGVGKGRTIAGLISEIVAVNKTESPLQAVRVLWISATLRLRADAVAEYGRTSHETDPAFAEIVRFVGYAGMTAKRQAQMKQWLSETNYPVVILDECHALRNPRGIQTQAMDLFLRQLGSAGKAPKVLYSSATACSVPKHMAYLTSLGLFGAGTPFPTFDAFHTALKRHGSSMMELMAIDLRARGAYTARQLGFQGVTVRHRIVCMQASERSVYDECTMALRQYGLLQGSCHQSFFQRLISGLKVREVIKVVHGELRNGHSVVISLVNTGEAVMKRSEHLSEGSYGALQHVGAETLRRAEVDYIDGLPQNPVDALLDHFGTDNVAELTGRRFRFELQKCGRRLCKRNPPLRSQVEDFQAGRKHVAIVSRAGGVGVSLHDIADGRPRTHVILEMPWSAEDLLQQIGRTHRSSSRTCPSYIIVTTDIPAEQRFASSLVRKLESFGALVKADRSSCSFPLMKTPRWTIAERRSIALCLSVAGAYSRDEADRLPGLTHAQALCVCDSQYNTSDATVKNRLIQMLHDPELGEQRLNVVAAVKKLFPRDVFLVMHNWTPVLHPMFPSPFRQQVTTLLLCAQAWETQNSLGLLSKDLLLHIVEVLACPFAIGETKKTADRFQEHKLKNLAYLSVDAMLNRMFGMECSVQKNIFAVADMLIEPKPRPPRACLLKYANDRAGSAISSSMYAVHPHKFNETVYGLCVHLQYAAQHARTPPLNADFWRHEKSERVCWLDNAASLMCFADSLEVSVPSCRPYAMHTQGYCKCQHDAWLKQSEQRRRTIDSRMSRLPKRFYLATQNAMSAWDVSMRRVLRIDPSDAYPSSAVGLLMYMQ